MALRYCSKCLKKLNPPLFLQNASSLPSSKVFATCYVCREKACKYRASKKRPALREIDLNIGPPPAQRRATSISRAPFQPSTINQGPIPPVRAPVSPVQPSRPPPIQPLPVQPQRVQPPPVPPPVQPPPPDSFLPADQWQRIRDFQTHMSSIVMETCTRCKARWFDMKLKDGICYNCVFKDKGGQTLYLFSAENKIDLGIVLAHFLALTQQRT